MNAPKPDENDRDRISLLQVGKLLEMELDRDERTALEARLNAEVPGYLERLHLDRPERNWRDLEAKAAARRLLHMGRGYTAVKTWVEGAVRIARRPAFAGIVALGIGAGLILWMNPPAHEKAPVIKGAEATGIRLWVNSVETNEMGTAWVGPGDTLTFQYRSPNPLFVEIWYRDDSSQPLPYVSEVKQWQPSLSWAPAPGRIVLYSGWSEETVFLLYSSAAFTAGEAREAVAGHRRPDRLGMRAFHLRARHP